MIIDVHGHVTSPELFKRYPMPPSLADIDGMIERKAALGVDLTIVGSPVGAATMVPVGGQDVYAQSADETDAFHEWVAETVREHWNHLRGYVYVNPFAGDDSMDRAANRLAQPEFVGLIVNTSVRGEYLDSPRAEALFALAAEANAPVLLHAPAEPVGAAAMRGHLGLIEHVARPGDVTNGVAAILFAGWLDRYPDLRLIAANAGGALSLLREKLDLARRAGTSSRPELAEPSMADMLRRLYVDTATPSKIALAAAAEVFGPEHMLFGTDSPPLTTPIQSAVGLVADLGLAADQQDRIYAGTAHTLFRLNGR